MNKKGFTLIELLAVIVLLAIVMVIAVPSIGGLIGSVQNNMLKEKATFIEEAAILLGQDIKGSIISSNLKYKNFNCKKFYVTDLVPTYLSKDNDNNCITCSEKDSLGNCITWSEGNIGCIVDPSNEENYLDQYQVIIYYQNKRIRAKLDIDNNLTCS